MLNAVVLVNMTENKMKILDVNNNPLIEGDSVKLLSASEDLLKGLPKSDKAAIQSQVNEMMIIQSISEYNYVELEFVDATGNTHFIWVDPKNVEKF